MIRKGNGCEIDDYEEHAASFICNVFFSINTIRNIFFPRYTVGKIYLIEGSDCLLSRANKYQHSEQTN